jgi:hypothetical protein
MWHAQLAFPDLLEACRNGGNPKMYSTGSGLVCVRNRVYSGAGAQAKLQDHAPTWTVDSVTDGVVAFDSAKALIDQAVAAVCRARVGHCVYDFVPYQTIRPLERAGPYTMVPQ